MQNTDSFSKQDVAILAGLSSPVLSREDNASDEPLDELEELLKTAGGRCAAKVLQKRNTVEPRTLLGEGKLMEIAELAKNLDAELIIIDNELSPAQSSAIEKLTGLRVMDRASLILDIFAHRARSAEGKLQVELAQLQYRSARLIGQGVALSRLAGGIGTRGPGESQLEMNRRRIRERMTELRRRLDQVERQREVRRKNRERNQVPVVALVGYTNSGKSTLLNTLTGAGVYVQDQLFATLDAVSRRMETAEHTPYLLVDTVGFIRKLPHALVSAFRSTLEEAALADVLVIVSDGASPDMAAQHETVERVLAELGAGDQPRVEAINKVDLGRAEPVFPGAVMISAKTGEGLDELRSRIAAELQKGHVTVTFALPFAQYGLLGQIRPLGRVLQEHYTDEGVELTAVLDQADLDRLIGKYGRGILKG